MAVPAVSLTAWPVCGWPGGVRRALGGAPEATCLPGGYYGARLAGFARSGWGPPG